MVLDNFRSQKIIWDRANKKIFEKIETNSGDSNGRKLVVQVINQGVTENLLGTTLSLGWKYRKGAKGLDAFDIVDASKGIFEIYYTTEMLSNIGNIEASLILIDSTSRIESSTFTISVRPSTVDDESVESENSFTALTEALVKVNDFDAQLAQKVGGGVKAEPEDLSAETLGLITGTGGPINLESIPQNKSVTTEKIATDGLYPTTVQGVDPVRTVNLLDKRTMTEGGYYSPNGVYTVNRLWSSSEYISVETGVTYRVNTLPNSYSLITSFWDSARNPVVKSGDSYNFTIPEDVSYIKVGIETANVDYLVVAKISQFPKEYIPYETFQLGSNWDVFKKTDYEKKIDIPIKNYITNGNFEAGVTPWRKGANSGSMTVENQAIKIANNISWYFGVYQYIDNLKIGHKYYITFDVYSDNFDLMTHINAYDDNAVQGSTGRLGMWTDVNSFENSSWYTLSDIAIPEREGTSIKINVQSKTADAVVSAKFTKIMLIDLTETFGAGNEPTKEEMDILIDLTPNKWWNGTLEHTQNLLLDSKTKALDNKIKALEENPSDKLFKTSPRLEEIMSYDFVCSIGYDDASASIYNHAFPVHQVHDVPGTFFVTTGMVDGVRDKGSWGPVVTWDQLREMHNSDTGTITVGHHSHSHLAYGSTNAAGIHADLSESMKIFLREGFKPKYMSYPGGRSSVLAEQYMSAYFEAARGANVNGGFNAGQNGAEAKKFYTDSVSLDAPSVSNIKSIITTAKNRANMVWFDFFLHGVFPEGVSPEGVSYKKTEELSEIIQFIKDNNGLIVSFDDAINVFMKNYYWTEHNTHQVIQ